MVRLPDGHFIQIPHGAVERRQYASHFIIRIVNLFIKWHAGFRVGPNGERNRSYRDGIPQNLLEVLFRVLLFHHSPEMIMS